jgi:hypothetical protein
MEYIRRRHYGLGIPWLSLVVLYYISPLHDLYGIHKYSPCHNLRPVAFNPCTQSLYASHVIILVPHEEDLDTMTCVDDCRREESQNSGLCLSALSSLYHLASCMRDCFLVQPFLLAQLLYSSPSASRLWQCLYTTDTDMAVAIATYLSTSEIVVTEVRHEHISSVVRKADWCVDHACVSAKARVPFLGKHNRKRRRGIRIPGSTSRFPHLIKQAIVCYVEGWHDIYRYVERWARGAVPRRYRYVTT